MSKATKVIGATLATIGAIATAAFIFGKKNSVKNGEKTCDCEGECDCKKAKKSDEKSDKKASDKTEE